MKQESSIKNSWWKYALPVSVLALTGIKIYANSNYVKEPDSNRYIPYCRDDYAPIVPNNNDLFYSTMSKILSDPDFKDEMAAKLSGAVKIPTVIGDVFPDPKDDIEFYAEFFKLHDYLEEQFPMISKHLKREKVNEVGLLYTWEGSDSSLKPVLFMAHQDEVLVNPDTIDEWSYPPFSGHYDGERIWGRGASDCKATLISEMIAIEELLKNGFEPKRTIILSFGFDEESGGEIGALKLSQFIEQRYGPDSIFSIMDEGMGVLQVEDGLYAALPITQEKGFTNYEVTIEGPGGHSSAPPQHTNIGILSEFVYMLENDPFDYVVEDTHPLLSFSQCVADFSQTIDPGFRHIIKQAATSDKYRKLFVNELEKSDPVSALTFRTSQAIDIFQSGIKVNALPETGKLEINYRIGMHSSIQDITNRLTEHVLVLSKKHKYNATVDGKVVYSSPENRGSFELSPYTSKNPSPRSPSYQDNDAIWDLFAGTVRDFFENRVWENESNKILVSTATMTPNTDTRHYWNLTKNIYRFQGAIFPPDLLSVAHSINEYALVSNVQQMTGFLYQYILNADSAHV